MRTAPTQLALVVRAKTRDAVPITVLATATLSVVEPWRTGSSLPEDPVGAAALEAEQAIGQALSLLNLDEIVEGFRPRPEEISRTTMLWGVEVEQITVDEIDARVVAGLRKAREAHPDGPRTAELGSHVGT